uniref:HATPase_c domain-containing protein n=1 Tax=Rhabditophanes sp. KR3021 TaxID=114890 RepID=A0AC35UAY2_9BILA
MSDSGSESDFGPTPTKKTNRASTTKSPTKKAQHDKTLHLSKKDLDVFTNIDKPHEKGGKTSIEQQYQKKTQLEHILLRPDTYIGSVQFCEKTTMWVYDKDKDSIVTKDISYVPGLYKIFDEILVNAADNKQRDKSMNVIKIDIDQQTNSISIFNNGKGVPVVMHKVEKMYVYFT